MTLELGKAFYRSGLERAAKMARAEAEAAVSPTTRRALRVLAYKLEREARGEQPLALVSTS